MMIFWTMKSLLSQPKSLVVSSIGIGLALILGLFLDAVFRGEAGQILTFVERSPGEVWVLEGGVENLHMARSTLSAQEVSAVTQVPGVESAMSIFYRDGLLGQRGAEIFTYVAGIPADAASRQLWEQTTGWTAPKPGNVIVPAPLSGKPGYALGDTVLVSGVEYKVGGYSDQTFSMANSLVFIDESDARKQFVLPEGANLVLALAEPGTTPEQLATRIEEQVADVKALTRGQLMDNDYSLALDMGGALISMMGMIGTMVAGLIVAFTAFAFVSDRISELAVTKALGAPRHQLILSALFQTGLVALLGISLALIAIFPLQAALTAWVPDVAVRFSLPVAIKLGAATFLAAELAALVPAIYVQKVDPALVFNG